ncbi:MAG: class B sortase [Erysipelotrichaceae bacterium]|nr:class B sortase [Erysipelotrichaceae bacterium]
MAKMKRRNISFADRTLWLIIAIAFVMIHVALFKLYSRLFDYLWITQETQYIYDTIHSDEIQGIEQDPDITKPDEPEANPYWDYIGMNGFTVDFDALKQINPEVVMWVNMQGLNINYPVVQHSDNEYYLYHSIFRSNNEAGWVFMDYRNDPKELHKNTILYAHGRLDGTMFGSLHRALKADWFDDVSHRTIHTISEDRHIVWQIFSVYRIPTTSDYIQTQFQDDKAYLQFLETLKQRSQYDFALDVNAQDHILTLSTCFDDQEKIVVHAKALLN